MNINDEKPYLSTDQKVSGELKNKLILVVDDMEFNLMIIKEMYNSAGFYNIITAQNGKQAMNLLNENTPDIVILDLVMPEFDGFQFLQEFRKHKVYSLTPVIVQTVMSAPDQKAKAFHLGATDFIAKPIDKGELIARSLVHLERKKLYDDLYETTQRIEMELMEARKMQDSLMPSHVSKSDYLNKYSVEIKSHFQPSSELGGDFWGCTELGNDCFAIYITDFSGHGVTAAMNIFRIHTIMQQSFDNMDNPGKYLEELNKKIMRVLRLGQYATMFYGVVNTRDNTLCFATAGCPDPLLYDAKTKNTIQIDGSGFPIGVFKEATYETKTIAFNKDSMIVLYSDALIETENDQGVFLSLEAVKGYLGRSFENKFGIAENFYSNLMREFNDNYAPRIRDDLTLAIFYRTGDAGFTRAS